MTQVRLRYRGSERPLNLPNYGQGTSSRIRRAVVESFIAAPDGGGLEETYEVIQTAISDPAETLGAGTIREAYRSLNGLDRIALFMANCNPDFSNAPSLPWYVKRLLRDDG